jgi:hypothetical protein
LLYHFPALFIVAGKLLEAGRTSGPSIRGAKFQQLAWSGEVPALVIHVVLASLAMAGLMLLGLALRWMKRDEEPAAVAKVGVWGGRWALGASLAQLPVGLWTLLTLPGDVQSRLMGTHLAGTLLFLAAMLAVFWLLRELAAVALGEVTRGTIMRSMSAMLVVVVLMTAMQQQVRPPPATVTAQGETR